MKTHKEKWLEAMIKKHGSEEAVREFMRANQRKSRENYSGKGGFYNNPELATLAGKKSAERRWGYVYKDKASTEA